MRSSRLDFLPEKSNHPIRGLWPPALCLSSGGPARDCPINAFKGPPDALKASGSL
jgi:hypothetical protein